jgi:2-C-methyl-D-erythritol 4-phosphate cytidylyltransferase
LFSISVLKLAYEQGDDGEFTDEAMLVERHGISVKTVDGDVNNIKLTYPVDLERLVGIKSCQNGSGAKTAI